MPRCRITAPSLPLFVVGQGEEEAKLCSLKCPRVLDELPSHWLNKLYGRCQRRWGVGAWPAHSALDHSQDTADGDNCLSLGHHRPPVNSIFPSISTGTDEWWIDHATFIMKMTSYKQRRKPCHNVISGKNCGKYLWKKFSTNIPVTVWKKLRKNVFIRRIGNRLLNTDQENSKWSRAVVSKCHRSLKEGKEI